MNLELLEIKLTDYESCRVLLSFADFFRTLILNLEIIDSDFLSALLLELITKIEFFSIFIFLDKKNEVCTLNRSKNGSDLINKIFQLDAFLLDLSFDRL